MQSTVGDVDGLDPQTQRKVDFYTQTSSVDALAPTNFALTNPEVLRATAESGGENLVKGLEHLLEDLEKGKGRLRVSMTDESAFKVGQNVAVTPGKVVFQNEMLQLIQYTPTTTEVKEIPLLIMPPWINKYYILDLRAKNSLVKWLTDQGYTTFIVSWVNPDETMAGTTFEDYMFKGAIAAKDAVLKASGASQNSISSPAIASAEHCWRPPWPISKAKGQPPTKTGIATATYFVTLTDFREVGDIRVFIDEEQVTSLEHRMDEAGGYLDAADMATSFNMLRSNDLIWSFVVNNYLMGKEPFPFDLLYWNADATRMPKAMHSFYLRNMYLENNLAKPGGISLGGVPIDLTTITLPTYMISCKEDHIAPWASTFEGKQGCSAGRRASCCRPRVTSPESSIRRPPISMPIGPTTRKPRPPEEVALYKSDRCEHPGSWWTGIGIRGSTPQSGKTIPARKPGDGKLKVIEDAARQLRQNARRIKASYTYTPHALERAHVATRVAEMVCCHDLAAFAFMCVVVQGCAFCLQIHSKSAASELRLSPCVSAGI